MANAAIRVTHIFCTCRVELRCTCYDIHRSSDLKGRAVTVLDRSSSLNLQQICREIARVLKPGGPLIATREHVVSDERQLPQFWANHPAHQLAGGEMAYELSRYHSSLRTAGFKSIRVYGPWDTIVNHFPSLTQDVVTAAKGHAIPLAQD